MDDGSIGEGKRSASRERECFEVEEERMGRAFSLEPAAEDLENRRGTFDFEIGAISRITDEPDEGEFGGQAVGERSEADALDDAVNLQAEAGRRAEAGLAEARSARSAGRASKGYGNHAGLTARDRERRQGNGRGGNRNRRARWKEDPERRKRAAWSSSTSGTGTVERRFARARADGGWRGVPAVEAEVGEALAGRGASADWPGVAVARELG